MDLEAVLNLSHEEFSKHVTARMRRRMNRGLARQCNTLMTRLKKAKKAAAEGERPEGIKTHVRNMIIVPEMIGSIVGVYSGKQYISVEIKPDMLGHYLAEFSFTYKPISHGRAGGKGAAFCPLK